MAARKKTYSYYENRTDYIDGNAARNLQAVPERRIPEPRRVPREESKRQPRALTGMGIGSLFVLTLAVIATVYVCVDYLQLHSEVSSLEKNNITLERTLANLSNKNDALYEQINTGYDLGYIYQVAVEELGMVYPDNNLVIKYESADGSYLRQYKDIPD